MKFLRLLPLTAFLFCACDSGEEEAQPPKTPEPSAKKLAEKQAKVEELEREIENRTNHISDMEAFVMMERAKIEDNPDYDQSFMEEALTDQDEQRQKIKEAQKQIKELSD